MKRWWLAIVSVAAVAGTSTARRVPRPPIPFDDHCFDVGAWQRVQRCIDTYEPGARVQELSPIVKRVSMADARQYLFVRLAERWPMVFRPGDGNYELVQTTTMTIHAQPALRIDLSHHVQLGNSGVFVERVTLVCPGASGACESMVTACTVIQRGRAVETFRGELRVTDAGVTVVGDRSQSGPYCLGR